MIGDIILLNRKKGGWFSACQRFFTKMPFTHSAVYAGKVLNEESVLSADELILLEPVKNYFEEDGTDAMVFTIDSITSDIKEKIVSDLYLKYNHSYYGFLQVVWFVYRWLGELVGIDMRKKTNWFTKGVICSELIWYYLDELGTYIPEIHKKLYEWNPDTIHAGDIYNICISLPNIFRRTL